MWRTWEIGRKTTFVADEFDGYTEIQGVVTEKHDDHLIVQADGQNLLVADFNADMFI